MYTVCCTTSYAERLPHLAYTHPPRRARYPKRYAAAAGLGARGTGRCARASYRWQSWRPVRTRTIFVRSYHPVPSRTPSQIFGCATLLTTLIVIGMSIYVVHYKEFRQNGRNLVTEAGEVGVGERRSGGDTARERERERERDGRSPHLLLHSPLSRWHRRPCVPHCLLPCSLRFSLLTAPPLSFSPST